MAKDVRELVRELKSENEKRSDSLNSGNLSDYAYTVQVHKYNYTIDIIKRLEELL